MKLGRSCFWSSFSAVVVLTKNKRMLKKFGVMDSKKLTPKKENYFCQKFYYFLQIMELGNPQPEK